MSNTASALKHVMGCLGPNAEVHEEDDLRKPDVDEEAVKRETNTMEAREPDIDFQIFQALESFKNTVAHVNAMPSAIDATMTRLMSARESLEIAENAHHGQRRVVVGNLREHFEATQSLTNLLVEHLNNVEKTLAYLEGGGGPKSAV